MASLRPVALWGASRVRSASGTLSSSPRALVLLSISVTLAPRVPCDACSHTAPDRWQHRDPCCCSPLCLLCCLAPPWLQLHSHCAVRLKEHVAAVSVRSCVCWYWCWIE